MEGRGCNPQTGDLLFNAFGVVSCNVEKSTYEFRAYTDGRRIDSLFESDGTGFAWGFDARPARVRHVTKVSEKGEWTETTKVKAGANPEMTMVEMLPEKVR